MNRAPFICALAVASLAGCATEQPRPPILDEARAQLETARADADAQRFASEEINKAQALAEQAESQLKDDAKQARHLAYLSTQMSQTAVAHGKARSAEDRLAAAAAERDRIRLEARTAEAEEARMDADRERGRVAMAEQRALTAEQRTAALQKEMTDLQGQRSERGVVVTLGDMLFDTGGDQLKSGADRRLDTVSTFMQQHPERYVLIEGFTDSVGSDEYNRQLSQRRADAVRRALVSRGVDASRIEVEGYGEQFPVGTNADAGGRQLNRRVEIILSTNDQPVTRR